MAIHWQINFKSLRVGTPVTVNIYDADYTGDPIPLKGGAEPFVTQEDDDEDIFTPVRTQSGYIRIVDDGKDANGNAFNWKDLVPSTDVDRPVTLTSDNVVLWQGFMQAQNFSGTLYGNPQEREFPVQCPLTVLTVNDISTQEREMKNFGYVIAQAFSSIPTLEFDQFVFQGGADAREWLLKLVDWQNYVTSEDDKTVQARYDYGIILEDICKFWGWSCRVHRRSVFFARVDDNDVEPKALVLTLSQLANLTDESGTVTENYLSSVSMSGDFFVSVDNDETMVRGYRKASVHSNAGEGDTTIIKAFPDAVMDEIEEEGQNYNVQYGDTIVYYIGNILLASSAFMRFSARSGYGSFDYITGTNNEENALNGPAIRIRKSYESQSAQAYVSLTTTFEHSYSVTENGGHAGRVAGLQFQGKIASAGEEFKIEGRNYRDAKPLWMRIGIGSTRATAKWYDGYNWSDTETACRAIIGTEDNIFMFMYQSGGGAIGYNNIVSTGNMKGLLFVELLGSNTMPEVQGERQFDIIDFKIELVYRSDRSRATRAEVTRNDRYDYTASTEGIERNDWDSDLIYASAPKSSYMAFGVGVVINENGTRLEKATYGENEEIPEQNLANRVAAYWGTSKRKITAELNTAVIPDITPRNTLTLDGTTCHPISISHDWWNDKTTLTLLEL